MSVSSGRMSRADAQAILQAIPPVLREFSSPDASPETLQEVADLSTDHGELQDSIDRGHAPNASAIRRLRTRVAALHVARLFHSESLPPRITQAVAVTLYGITDNTVEAAALHAQQALNDYVRLQDSSHVRTATLTGTRYIFTSRTP